MNEEEKNAINFLQKLEFDEYEWWYSGEEYKTREEDEKAFEKAQKIIINLIEKQQNEIEYYKSELELETSSWKKLEKAENLISKDKIKEIFYNKRNKIIFIKNRNERLDKVKILDEIEKELLEEGGAK